MNKLVIVFMISTSAFAADNWCRDMAGSSESYNMGTSIRQSNFYVDSDSENPNSRVLNCPEITNNCIDKYNPIVKEHSKLIIGKQYKTMVCVYNIANGITGWIPRSAVRPQPRIKVDNKQLLGKWFADAAVINFTKAASNFVVTGSAKWYGGPDGDIVHTGEFSANIAESQIRNGVGRLKDNGSDCVVDFYLVANKYLVISDNNQCGGANVRFNDIFTKKNL
jgi:hypothetical protein